MPPKSVPPQRVSRRVVVAGVGAVSAAPALAACGTDEATDPAADAPAASTPSGSSAPTAGSSGTPSAEAPAADALASTSDIEVGGGAIFPDEQVVITQPTEGEFKAFDAACTHQGCLVAEISDGTINCTCHMSKFSIEDGSVQGGPAPDPLPEVPITVQGDQIILG